jgi:hypothetical protein
MSERDYVVLPSGRRFYANNGIVGIDAQGNVSEGYDGSVDVEGLDWADPPVPPWTPEERAELADMMIRRWELFKGSR